MADATGYETRPSDANVGQRLFDAAVDVPNFLASRAWRSAVIGGLAVQRGGASVRTAPCAVAA